MDKASILQGKRSGQFLTFLILAALTAFISTAEASPVIVKRGGATIGSYLTIQAAYDQCQDQDVIETQATTIYESPYFNSPISVTLKGGYDSAFVTQSGMTTISGAVTINSGALNAENLIIVPPPAQGMAGIWTGTLTSNVVYQTFNIVGLIAESGNARFVDVTGGAQYSGTVSPIGSSFSTTATAYAPFGYVFPNGSKVGPVNLYGTFTPKVSISGNYNGVGDAGWFSAYYSALYERPSSFTAISGSWSGNVSGYANYVTVDSRGIIGGTVMSTCSCNGDVGIVDGSYNVYNVTLNVYNCGSLSGNYIGLAALADTVVTNDSLIVSISNATNSFVALLRRQ